MSYWSGKSVVIVGGSAGLGRSLAERLALSNARSILVVARDRARLDHMLNEFHQRYPEVELVTCATDVSSPEGAMVVQHRIEELGWTVDLLINAVGLSDRGWMLKVTPQRLAELLKANIYGPLWSTQTIVPRMKSGSVIINIGSLASHFAPRYLGGYTLVKHGLRGLTQQLRLELADEGIHVMLACPGPIQRADSDARYDHLPGASDLPPEALKSGGGAKLKGLDPDRLSIDILDAAARRCPELVRPRKARILMILMAISPTLGERLLKRMS